MPSAEHRDNAHHLRAADGLAHAPLVAPREVRLAPLLDLAHGRNKARQERRVEALLQRVDAELVEWVERARRPRVRAERGLLQVGTLFVVLASGEVFRLDKLEDRQNSEVRYAVRDSSGLGAGKVAVASREVGREGFFNSGPTLQFGRIRGKYRRCRANYWMWFREADCVSDADHGPRSL